MWDHGKKSHVLIPAYVPRAVTLSRPAYCSMFHSNLAILFTRMLVEVIRNCARSGRQVSMTPKFSWRRFEFSLCDITTSTWSVTGNRRSYFFHPFFIPFISLALSLISPLSISHHLYLSILSPFLSFFLHPSFSLALIQVSYPHSSVSFTLSYLYLLPSFTFPFICPFYHSFPPSSFALHIKSLRSALFFVLIFVPLSPSVVKIVYISFAS
jgi:hypothetical protein